MLLKVDSAIGSEKNRDHRIETLEKKVQELSALREEMAASLAYIKSNWKPTELVDTSPIK